MNLRPTAELNTHLDSGEHLLWSGQPRQGLRFRTADLLLVPFSLFWAGIAFSWQYVVLQAGFNIFALFGIPFVLSGIYITVGRFFVDAKRREKTFYGLTPTRALIVSGLFRQKVQSVPLQTVTDLTMDEWYGGRGSWRGENGVSSSDGSSEGGRLMLHPRQRCLLIKLHTAITIYDHRLQ